MNLVNDLRTLDEGLYKNLMFLKTYSVSTGLEGSVGIVCCVGLWYEISMDCRFHVVSC
jgi:hypothetical protein